MENQTTKTVTASRGKKLSKVCFLLILLLTMVLLASCGKKLNVFDAVSLEYPTDLLYKIDWKAITKDNQSVCQTAISGFGEVQLSVDFSKLDYDTSNTDITDFLNSIEFVCEAAAVDRGKGSLQNGDKVTVSLQYSKSKAKELGITLAADKKTFTVEFKEIFRNKKDISDSDLKEIIANIEEYDWSGKDVLQVYYAYYLDNAGDQYLSVVTIAYNEIYDYMIDEYIVEKDTNHVLSHISLKSSLWDLPDEEDVKHYVKYSGKEFIDMEFVKNVK